MAARESRVRMRDKTNAGNVFTVLRGVSEMRNARAGRTQLACDVMNLYDALNPCRAAPAGLLTPFNYLRRKFAISLLLSKKILRSMVKLETSSKSVTISK